MNNTLPSILEGLKPILVQLLSEALVSALQTVKADQPRYPQRVTVEQASEITGYKKNSLYQMHSKGLIPGAFKVGGKLLFDTNALVQWVETGGKKQTMGNLAPNDCQSSKKEFGLPKWPRQYEN